MILLDHYGPRCQGGSEAPYEDDDTKTLTIATIFCSVPPLTLLSSPSQKPLIEEEEAGGTSHTVLHSTFPLSVAILIC